MRPVLFDIGSIHIFSYGIMVALAFLLAIYLASREGRRAGLAPEKILDIGLYSLIFGIAGARLLHVLLDLGYYSNHPFEIIMVNRGGLAIHGGLISGITASWIYIKRNNMPLWKTFDLFIPYVALGQAIGRVGCLLNGCCYGIPTGITFGLRLPDHLQHLHPTQLYSSIFFLLMFAALRSIYKKKKFDGAVFFSYLLMFSTGRFLIDFIRGDLHAVFLGLKTSQWISIGIFLIALFFKKKFSVRAKL